MKTAHMPGAVAAIAALLVSNATSSVTHADNAAPAATSVRDFDFEFGHWRVHHRIKRPADAKEWTEFDGTCVTRPLMDGAMNVEDHIFHRPAGLSRGVALRAYDEKTGQWAIWWVDSRNPHGPVDPPMLGRFENGVGTFYSDGMLDGKPVRTRFIWSHITPESARWEQAFSFDSGKTWRIDWIMEFERTRPPDPES